MSSTEPSLEMPSPYNTSNSAVLNGGAHLVLDDLDLGAIAYSLITILDGLDTSNIHADGRVELQRLAAGGRFRIAEEHTDLLSKLVDENGGGAR